MLKEMREVVIVDGCRTAVGNMGGALKPLHAVDLAECVLKGSLDRTGVDPKEIDEVILGQCRQTSDEPNIARVAALRVGIPDECPAYTVMRQCASGMTAVQNGAMEIMTGHADVVLAGGTESMSNAVFYLRDARWGVGTGNVEFVDALTEGQFQSQPPETYGRYNMGATARTSPSSWALPAKSRMLFQWRARDEPSPPSTRAASRRRSSPSWCPRGAKTPRRGRHRRVPQARYQPRGHGEAEALLQYQKG
jgi:acetyl-CoA C-acetyltransferase